MLLDAGTTQSAKVALDLAVVTPLARLLVSQLISTRKCEAKHKYEADDHSTQLETPYLRTSPLFAS